VRRALHSRGCRYRKHFPIDADGLIVRPDIVFSRARVAVFIDGCFWHSCPLHGNTPQTNQHYWLPKLRRNTERDELVNQRLEEAGWRVLRVWEHVATEEAADSIVETVRTRRSERDLLPTSKGAYKRMEDYLDAAARKIDIAGYHVGRLAVELSDFRGEKVPIPVQAHFEGLLYSAAAASDQVGRALRSAESEQVGELREHVTLEKVLAAMNPRKSFVVPLGEWNSAALLKDARKVRNMATHAHYEKTPRGVELEVQKVSDGQYRGSRELGSYSRALLKHLNGLKPQLARLRDEYLR
jgi:DNA mismatch endonuclease, patch repair protein